MDPFSQTVWESVEGSPEGKKTLFRSVQEYNHTIVSCENRTCTAVGEEPKGLYVKRNIGGVFTTQEMSGYGSTIYRIIDFGIPKGFMRKKIQL